MQAVLPVRLSADLMAVLLVTLQIKFSPSWTRQLTQAPVPHSVELEPSSRTMVALRTDFVRPPALLAWVETRLITLVSSALLS